MSNRRNFIKATVLAATPVPPTLDEIIEKRVRILTDYQDADYAARYRNQVATLRAAETAINSSQLTEAVAHNLFKLMAIKDEYEVARL